MSARSSVTLPSAPTLEGTTTNVRHDANYSAAGGGSVRVVSFDSGVVVSVPAVGASTVVIPPGATSEVNILHVVRAHARVVGVRGDIVSSVDAPDGSRVFRVGFETVSDVKRANTAHGHYWFSPGTLRHFSSVHGRTLYGGVFLTVSDVLGEGRVHRVIRVEPSGAVGHVDADARYSSAEAARREAKRLASLLPVHVTKKIVLPVPSA